MCVSALHLPVRLCVSLHLQLCAGVCRCIAYSSLFTLPLSSLSVIPSHPSPLSPFPLSPFPLSPFLPQLFLHYDNNNKIIKCYNIFLLSLFSTPPPLHTHTHTHTHTSLLSFSVSSICCLLSSFSLSPSLSLSSICTEVSVILHGDMCFSAWDQSDKFVQVCVWLSQCNFTWRSVFFSLGSVRQVDVGLCLTEVSVILHGDLCFSAWDQSDKLMQICVWLKWVSFYMIICVFKPGIISVRQACAGLCLA